jgi:protein SCO1/2
MVKRLVISLGVGLVLAFGIVFLTLREPTTWYGTHLSPPMTAADFTLQSADGPVSVSDFRGKAVALFFGYTSCPDVCPTTLLRLSRAVDQLDAADRDRVQVVFISIDPERDTPQRTSRYAQAVNPSFVGLSGTPQQIADVAAKYGIFYQKAEGSEATGYLMDHSATITVLNPAGKVELMWSPTVTADQMTSDLEAIL